MEPTHNTTWEQAVAQIARRFEYPATPDIVAGIGQRTTDHGPQPTVGGRWGTGVALPDRLAWAALVITLLLAGALAVPQTRAALLTFFARIGAIDIFIDDTALPATPTDGENILQQPATIPPTTTTAATSKPTTAPDESVSHSMALFELGRATTLDEARRRSDFPLAVPAALGEPDEVYRHGNVDLPAVTLVWRDVDGEPLSLTEIGIGEFARKMVGEEGVKYILIGDRPGVWIEGPHTVQLLGYQEAGSLPIRSNVLIWADGDITYRLEGDLSEEEMVEIAESLSH